MDLSLNSYELKPSDKISLSSTEKQVIFARSVTEHGSTPYIFAYVDTAYTAHSSLCRNGMAEVEYKLHVCDE